MLTSLFSLGVFLGVTGGAPDSVTAQDIQKAYAATIQLQAIAVPGYDTLIALDVKAPPAASLLSGFFRDNERWFGYLVRNGRGFQLPALDLPQPTGFRVPGYRVATSKLQQDFIRRLMADAQFNALVLPAIGAYLRQSGVKVSNAISPPRYETIPIDTAMKTAVRFFYPDILTPNGILTHVCTVINAVRELPSRNLSLEALAFSAIMGDVMRDSSYIEPDFGPARRLMNELDTKAASDSVRLGRAQGVMWASMAKSARLRYLLQAEANRQKTILPFELVAS